MYNGLPHPKVLKSEDIKPMLNRYIDNFKAKVRSYIRGVAAEKQKHPLELADSTVYIGERVTMADTTMLSSHVSVSSGCYLNNVQVGSYSYLSFNVSASNTHIGKFCSIAQGVGICMGMHPSNTFVSTSPVFFSTIKQCGTTFADQSYFQEMGSCSIGNDVWIGANALIMDNINIGDGAIIGAGCIVTKDVPPYAIVVGIPGKIIQYRFSKEEINFLLDFKWWDKDDSWIKANYKQFHDIRSFKNAFEGK